MSAVASAVAHWNSLYQTRHVSLTEDAEVPFSQGRLLGSGGVGAVFETELGGIGLAWKRSYTRRLTNLQMNEITILRQLCERENHHKHVVELIGSYDHRQNGQHIELGLLLWPVAQCDLSSLLHDIDNLEAFKQLHNEAAELSPTNEVLKSVHNLAKLGSLNISVEELLAIDLPLVVQMLDATLQRLRGTYGCIAGAVAYLHQQEIRHKDLKPSQILISPDGLWLTDFGWAVDHSELSGSATNNQETTTRRYHAPERARGERCGKPEDVFALGCTFLEISLRILRCPANAHLNPRSKESWSFQGNITELDAWINPVRRTQSNQLGLLAVLLERMLSNLPEDRPSIEQVTDTISIITNMRTLDDNNTARFHGICCQTSAERQATQAQAQNTSLRQAHEDNTSLIGDIERLEAIITAFEEQSAADQDKLHAEIAQLKTSNEIQKADQAEKAELWEIQKQEIVHQMNQEADAKQKKLIRELGDLERNRELDALAIKERDDVQAKRQAEENRQLSDEVEKLKASMEVLENEMQSRVREKKELNFQLEIKTQEASRLSRALKGEEGERKRYRAEARTQEDKLRDGANKIRQLNNQLTKRADEADDLSQSLGIAVLQQKMLKDQLMAAQDKLKSATKEIDELDGKEVASSGTDSLPTHSTNHRSTTVPENKVATSMQSAPPYRQPRPRQNVQEMEKLTIASKSLRSLFQPKSKQKVAKTKEPLDSFPSKYSPNGRLELRRGPGLPSD